MGSIFTVWGLLEVYLGSNRGLSEQLKFNYSVYFTNWGLFGDIWGLFGVYFHYLGSIGGLLES